MILKEYCKPHYVEEIREAIIRGDDPKTINRLQTLRSKLGLDRPKEDYEELLMLRFQNNDTNDNDINSDINANDNDNENNINNSPDPYEYVVGRKDGTVHIGSSPGAL